MRVALAQPGYGSREIQFRLSAFTHQSSVHLRRAHAATRREACASRLRAPRRAPRNRPCVEIARPVAAQICTSHVRSMWPMRVMQVSPTALRHRAHRPTDNLYRRYKRARVARAPVFSMTSLDPIANHALSVYPELLYPGFESSKVFAVSYTHLTLPTKRIV